MAPCGTLRHLLEMAYVASRSFFFWVSGENWVHFFTKFWKHPKRWNYNSKCLSSGSGRAHTSNVAVSTSGSVSSHQLALQAVFS